MVLRMQNDAHLVPQAFIGADGKFNLVELCMAASLLSWPVHFVGVWDGSLPLACALAVMQQTPNNIPRGLPFSYEAREKEYRMLSGYTGDYQDYYEYAHEYRINEVLQRYLQNGGLPQEWPGLNPVASIQPHAHINTGVMWFFAVKIGRSSSSFRVGSGPEGMDTA